MYIVDSHCDSIQKVDAGKFGIVNPYNFSGRRCQLQFVALFCGWPGENADQGYLRASRYMNLFRTCMEKERDRVEQVRTYPEILRAFAAGRHAALLTMEGGTGIKGDKQILRDFYNLGVRVFGLAWNCNDLAKSSRVENGEDTGLTPLGKEIVAEGNRLGMIFDASHLSDKSFWDLAELAEKPVVATHSNFRGLCREKRNLTDEMVKELIRRGGIIGLNLVPRFLHEEPAQRTVECLFRHLEYGLSLGTEDCIGFGCDIDGTSGLYPSPLDESGPIHDRLIDFMLSHNYPQELVEKVAGGNWMAYLERNL